ncbi:MAG TPA: YIP1 family protein [Longimicrobium sp.]|nr:YIP1 family protein [Longimicrobium sp.]
MEGRSLTERMMGAAMLDVSVYEEVEADQNATGQAAAVVTIVAICGAIGAINEGGKGIIGAVIGALVGWLIWAAPTYVVGTLLFRGTATWSELLRTLGFAQAPGVLYALGIVPLFGGLISAVVALWTLVTCIVAIRQALDISTGKAIVTAIIARLVVWAFMAVLALFGLGIAAMAGVFS